LNCSDCVTIRLPFSHLGEIQILRQHFLDFHTWYRTTDIMIFFGLFCHFQSSVLLPLPPGKCLIAIFRSFLLFFGLFSFGLPGNFCADAFILASLCYASECIINIRLTSYSNLATIKIRLTFNPKLYGNFCA